MGIVIPGNQRERKQELYSVKREFPLTPAWPGLTVTIFRATLSNAGLKSLELLLTRLFEPKERRKQAKEENLPLDRRLL